jgi:hypothetical protein
MSLTDCVKCWDTPCGCGYEYRKWPVKAMCEHIASITQYRTKEEAKKILEEAWRMVDENEKWISKENPISK